MMTFEKEIPGCDASILVGPPLKDERERFLVVGIGTSAGGLEALGQFFEHLPLGTGVAFVIVQHLDPTYKGMLPELLQRITPLDVYPVTDGLKVEPDCVYVIPPNKDLSLLNGFLYLLDVDVPRGVRHPIDTFFQSLSDDLKNYSIGVILTGMGSDGTEGIRAIKGRGGASFVQDPASAKFDAMPRSVIDAGLADTIAPIEELPGKIIEYVSHISDRKRSDSPIDTLTLKGIDKVLILLRAHSGNDFTQYKTNTILRRIKRRMIIHQIENIAEYIRFLQMNPKELDLLFNELLIGVTSFFRDPPVWEYLKDHVIPDLLIKDTESTGLKAWVVGCSTGEEAYSLAIVIREAMDLIPHRRKGPVQIYATDIDRDAIERARKGFYPENIIKNVSLERLNRFFIREETGYRIRKEIRELVVFAPQNLTMDPPFTQLALLSCRNLLIYLNPDLQRVILPLFHYSLKEDGILLLGSAETIGNFTNLFSPLDDKLRLYKRIKSLTPTDPVLFPISSHSSKSLIPCSSQVHEHKENIESLVSQIILEHHSPSAVLSNKAGDIIYISGRTGKYLEPPVGKANWNLFAMVRSGLRDGFESAFYRAAHSKDPIVFTGISGERGAQTCSVDVIIQKIIEPPTLNGYILIVFVDRSLNSVDEVESRGHQSHLRSSRKVPLTEMKRKLKEAEKVIKATREEMQISREELRSSNEEFQSINEEIQSTNEELMTSKEEMQSLNEELQTVNMELQSRIDELSTVNNDMLNLLNNTDLSVISLDEKLNLRFYSTAMSTIANLIPGDIGRPITDLASDLFYTVLPRDVQRVLRTLVPIEQEIRSRDGRVYLVRIMLYKTLDNRIDGVIITFVDITVHRELESELTATRNHAEAIIATIREPLLTLDSRMHILSANRSFYEIFHLSPIFVIGEEIYALENGEWDIPRLRELLEAIISKGTPFDNFQVSRTFSKIGHKKLLLNARKIIAEDSEKDCILLAIEDVTGMPDGED